jgi:hypothetical protein
MAKRNENIREALTLLESLNDGTHLKSQNNSRTIAALADHLGVEMKRQPGRVVAVKTKETPESQS